MLNERSIEADWVAETIQNPEIVETDLRTQTSNVRSEPSLNAMAVF